MRNVVDFWLSNVGWSIVKDGEYAGSGSFIAIGPDSEDVTTEIDRQKDELLLQFSEDDRPLVVFDEAEPVQRWILLNASVVVQLMIFLQGLEDAFPARPAWIIDYNPGDITSDEIDTSGNFFP